MFEYQKAVSLIDFLMLFSHCAYLMLLKSGTLFVHADIQVYWVWKNYECLCSRTILFEIIH